MSVVFNLQRYSLHDGPGIRTTVFLKGCPLRCWWCHNPESQSPDPELVIRAERCTGCGACARVCPHGAIVDVSGILVYSREKCAFCGKCAAVCVSQSRVMLGREKTVEQVMAEIVRDTIFYDESGGGVTFSGGEPLSQPDFLADLLDACRKQGISTAVDTCGFVAKDTLLGIAQKTDLFLYDLKVMDSVKHERYTGVPNAVILDNLRALSETASAVIVRIPLVPGINDDEENLTATGRFLADLSDSWPVSILPYHDTGSHKYARLGKLWRMGSTASPTEKACAQASRILEGFGLTVSIGG